MPKGSVQSTAANRAAKTVRASSATKINIGQVRIYQAGNAVQEVDPIWEGFNTSPAKRKSSSKTAAPAKQKTPGKKKGNAARKTKKSGTKREENKNKRRTKVIVFEEALLKRGEYWTLRGIKKNPVQRVRLLDVIFILLLCMAITVPGVMYLRLKSQDIILQEDVIYLQNRLNTLRSDNNAYEDTVKSHINLNDIQETAVNKLGLHMPEPEQVRYYSVDDNSSYVLQYMNVPGS